LCSASASQVAAQVAKLHPSDEAPRDPSLCLTRAGLLQAAVSPNIKNGFGGDDGSGPSATGLLFVAGD